MTTAAKTLCSRTIAGLPRGQVVGWCSALGQIDGLPSEALQQTSGDRARVGPSEESRPARGVTRNRPPRLSGPTFYCGSSRLDGGFDSRRLAALPSWHMPEDVPRTPSLTTRGAALVLAEELLSDIELERIDPMAVIRKASRLARLLDDPSSMRWLSYEVTGYPTPGDSDSGDAARRSCRWSDDGSQYYTALVGELQANIDSATIDLRAGTGDTSDSDYAVLVEKQKADRRSSLIRLIAERRQLLDRVLGAVHTWVAARYQELRFGSAIENAFDVVRREVDGSIAALVPDALPMLSAAFENASSDNPEHRQGAASTCRRLLKTAADKLRAPGPDVDGRKMGPDNYVNRLVNWIENNATSETAAQMIAADLEHLGPRLDAADKAGQKGAHVGRKPVTREEASRFVVGTYLILGDILNIGKILPPEPAPTASDAIE